LIRTLARRPDILEKANLSAEDKKIVERLRANVKDDSENA
jgi:hypothetical protein